MYNQNKYLCEVLIKLAQCSEDKSNIAFATPYNYGQDQMLTPTDIWGFYPEQIPVAYRIDKPINISDRNMLNLMYGVGDEKT